jgi:hypothetical protein
LSHVQVDDPAPLDPVTHAILQSEYTTKYVTKSEITAANDAVIKCAALLADPARDDVSKAVGILSKLMNQLNKTTPYALVTCVSYLLGYGDCWFPLETTKLNIRLLQQRVEACSMYDNPEINFDLVRVNAPPKGDNLMDELAEQRADDCEDDDGNVADHCPPLRDSDSDDDEDEPRRPGVVAVFSDVDQYTARHESLSSFSAYEMAMAFKLTNNKPTKAAKLFPLDSSRPVNHKCWHKPRMDRSKALSTVLPQSFHSFPRRPTDDNPESMRNNYATLALATFFPFDRRLDLLQGDSWWAKFVYWRAHVPRGPLCALLLGPRGGRLRRAGPHAPQRQSGARATSTATAGVQGGWL